jgi:hypothetical protein
VTEDFAVCPYCGAAAQDTELDDLDSDESYQMNCNFCNNRFFIKCQEVKRFITEKCYEKEKQEVCMDTYQTG